MLLHLTGQNGWSNHITISFPPMLECVMIVDHDIPWSNLDMHSKTSPYQELMFYDVLHAHSYTDTSLEWRLVGIPYSIIFHPIPILPNFQWVNHDDFWTELHSTVVVAKATWELWSIICTIWNHLHYNLDLMIIYDYIWLSIGHHDSLIRPSGDFTTTLP